VTRGTIADAVSKTAEDTLDVRVCPARKKPEAQWKCKVTAGVPVATRYEGTNRADLNLQGMGWITKAYILIDVNVRLNEDVFS
jgi:hypothetical protein